MLGSSLLLTRALVRLVRASHLGELVTIADGYLADINGACTCGGGLLSVGESDWRKRVRDLECKTRDNTVGLEHQAR